MIPVDRCVRTPGGYGKVVNHIVSDITGHVTYGVLLDGSYSRYYLSWYLEREVELV